MDKRRKYFIIGILHIPAAFYFLYLSLRADPNDSVTHLGSLIFSLILFYFGGRFLYKGWKNDKKENTTVWNLKQKRMIAIGMVIIMIIIIILDHYSK